MGFGRKIDRIGAKLTIGAEAVDLERYLKQEGAESLNRRARRQRAAMIRSAYWKSEQAKKKVPQHLAKAIADTILEDLRPDQPAKESRDSFVQPEPRNTAAGYASLLNPAAHYEPGPPEPPPAPLPPYLPKRIELAFESVRSYLAKVDHAAAARALATTAEQTIDAYRKEYDLPAFAEVPWQVATSWTKNGQGQHELIVYVVDANQVPRTLIEFDERLWKGRARPDGTA